MPPLELIVIQIPLVSIRDQNLRLLRQARHVREARRPATRTSAHETLLRLPVEGLRADEARLALRVVGARLDRLPRRRRLYPLLLKAGATLPTAAALPPLKYQNVLRDPYLRQIVAAGGFPAYERRHVNALAASFGPKLGLLPEIARVVVRFAFHCGYY